MGDKFALSSVVTNLLENAVKYSGPCAEVSVKLCKIDEKPFLSVSDRGLGIPDNEKMLIFDKFYRVGDEEIRTQKGSGLGLYISQEFVKLHKGIIGFKSNKEKGSIFYFKLPL
jgi:signal transduction histidine kinase